MGAEAVGVVTAAIMARQSSLGSKSTFSGS